MLGCRSGSMYLFQTYPRDLLFLISCVPTDQNESHKLESPPCSGRHTIAFHEQKKGAKALFFYKIDWINWLRFDSWLKLWSLLCDLLSKLSKFTKLKLFPHRIFLDENGILLQKLFWPTVRKNCSSDREKLLKFEAEGWEFAKFLRSLEQFFQAVKGQNNFW